MDNINQLLLFINHYLLRGIIPTLIFNLLILIRIDDESIGYYFLLLLFQMIEYSTYTRTINFTGDEYNNNNILWSCFFILFLITDIINFILALSLIKYQSPNTILLVNNILIVIRTSILPIIFLGYMYYFKKTPKDVKIEYRELLYKLQL